MRAAFAPGAAGAPPARGAALVPRAAACVAPAAARVPPRPLARACPLRPLPLFAGPRSPPCPSIGSPLSTPSLGFPAVAPARPSLFARVVAYARQRLRGTVVSVAPMKTCVVRVDRMVPHPKYKKLMRRSKKFLAHDEFEVARLGDRVTIEQCRPLSARKRFRLHSIDFRPKSLPL